MPDAARGQKDYGGPGAAGGCGGNQAEAAKAGTEARRALALFLRPAYAKTGSCARARDGPKNRPAYGRQTPQPRRRPAGAVSPRARRPPRGRENLLHRRLGSKRYERDEDLLDGQAAAHHLTLELGDEVLEFVGVDEVVVVLGDGIGDFADLARQAVMDRSFHE